MRHRTPRARGQPRRGYRRPKPTAHSDVGRLRSRRAACFLLHTFLSPPKEKCERPIGLQALLPRRSRRVNPSSGKGGLRLRAPKRLSSGQTIGAARTAVRSACCLPERPVANRLRRLYPLDTRFPSFPFGNLRAPKVARKPMDGNPAVRTEVGAPDPCKGPLRSIVFPGPISPMESLLPFLDIPLFGAPTPRCRIAFFSFFLFFRSRKQKESPLLQAESCPILVRLFRGKSAPAKKIGDDLPFRIFLVFFLN